MVEAVIRTLVVFGSYFLTIIHVEDHLWLYFVYFLNHLSIYEEIHHYISLYKQSNLNSTLSSSFWKVFVIQVRWMICLSCFKFTFEIYSLIFIYWINLPDIYQQPYVEAFGNKLHQKICLLLILCHLHHYTFFQFHNNHSQLKIR